MEGKQSVKISSTTQTPAYLNHLGISVQAGDKLTVSSAGRLENVTGNVGAYIGLEFYDANLTFIGATNSNTYKGNGNVKFISTETAPTNSAYVFVVIVEDQVSGSVWFDGIQLEKPLNADEGHILTDFDSIENSSFERGGYLWSAGGPSGTVAVTTENPWAGSRSAKINLTSTSDAWIGMNIPVKAEQPMTLSGFVKTVNLSGSGAHLVINYYDGTGALIKNEESKLQKGTQDYTRYAISTTPPTNATSASVYGVVWSSTGTAYFDNIKLTQSSTTQYEYDSTGNNLISEIDAFGNLTKYTYDSIGNKASFTDSKGYMTSYTYDGNNNLKTVKDAKQKSTYYDYDPVNLQVSIRDARSSSSSDNTYRTSFAYNGLNDITNMVDSFGRIVSYTYDMSGNLDSTTYPTGKKVLNTYDAANRLSQKSYNGSTKKWNFNYDGAGNLNQVTDELARSYSFTYDGASRLTKMTNLFGYYLNYQMDEAGNVISVSDTKNKTISYSYGSDNRILSLTDSSGKVTKFRYDESGRPFEIVRGNGIKSVQVFDRLGRLTELSDPRNPDGSIFFYEYDKNSNITAIREAYGNQLFTYDELNRLTSWTDVAGTVTNYGYDSVGNMTKKGTKTYTYNAANEITNAGFTYDQNGNMTSDGKFNYLYNHENQLAKVTKVSDGTTIATYSYDYRGLRTSKTIGTSTISYHWDDQNRLIRESDSNGNTLVLYIYSENQLVAIEKNGVMYYVHTNHHGDILALSDSTGNQVATYKYGPWGEFLGKTGTVDIPIRYAGYYYDEETSLYYLKARYYSPESARFLTKDGLGYSEINNPQSLNLYAYTNNNPITYVDPDGNTAVIAIYFVPGIGQVALMATGAVVLAGITYRAASWIGKKAGEYYYSKKHAPKQKESKQKKETPRNNQAQNKQTTAASKKYKLNKQQERELHDAVSGRNYGYKEIERIAKEIKNGTW